MSLETIVDLFVAYQRTAAVKTGVELDIFTAIGEGVDSVGNLAVRCAIAERGIVTLLDTLSDPAAETVLTQRVTLMVATQGA